MGVRPGAPRTNEPAAVAESGVKSLIVPQTAASVFALVAWGVGELAAPVRATAALAGAVVPPEAAGDGDAGEVVQLPSASRTSARLHRPRKNLADQAVAAKSRTSHLRRMAALVIRRA